MPKSLIRFVALLLISCLLADPLLASVPINRSLTGTPETSVRFEEAALAPIPLWMHLATSHLTMALERLLGHQFFLALLRPMAEWADKESPQHVYRVSQYAAIIAEEMGLSPEWITQLRVAGVLHDIGKIGVSKKILGKPGPLTPEEKKKVAPHTKIGRWILGPGVAGQAALSHHEWWDGSGYPKGLKGDQIPLEGRIIAIADVFDALSQRRVYRQGLLTFEEAVQKIREGSGSQFDPRIVDVFLSAPTLYRIRTVYNESPARPQPSRVHNMDHVIPQLQTWLKRNADGTFVSDHEISELWQVLHKSAPILLFVGLTTFVAHALGLGEGASAAVAAAVPLLSIPLAVPATTLRMGSRLLAPVIPFIHASVYKTLAGESVTVYSYSIGREKKTIILRGSNQLSPYLDLRAETQQENSASIRLMTDKGSAVVVFRKDGEIKNIYSQGGIVLSESQWNEMMSPPKLKVRAAAAAGTQALLRAA